MDFDIEKIIQNISKIKLYGGLVGKVSIVLIIVCLCLTGLALSLKIMWLTVTTISFIFLLVFIMLWRLISFANKNPQAALLEGAEFLVHEQMLFASKNQSQTSIDTKNLTEEKTTQINKTDISTIDLPDIKEKAILHNSKGEIKNG